MEDRIQQRKDGSSSVSDTTGPGSGNTVDLPGPFRPAAAAGDASENTTKPRTRDLTRRIINNHRVTRRIKAGGMGEVWEAHLVVRNGVEAKVPKALKVILPDKLDQVSEARFKLEAEVASQIKSPYVCRVDAAGVDDGLFFIVMEFAERGSLADYVSTLEGQRLPMRKAVRWLRQAAEGLLAAEQNRDDNGNPAPIYHRDIKPQNLLLTEQENLLIADFGIAKLGGQTFGQLTGDAPPMSLNYASPEQCEATPLDHRSDMYSLGRTFHLLLTGELPRRDKPADPRVSRRDLPRPLGRIIVKMTEPDPDRRYRSFADVVHELRELEKQLDRPKWIVTVGVTTLVLVSLFAVLFALDAFSFSKPSSGFDKPADALEQWQTLGREAGALVAEADWTDIGEVQGRAVEVKRRVVEALTPIASVLRRLQPTQLLNKDQPLEGVDRYAVLRDDLMRVSNERTNAIACRKELEALQDEVASLARVDAQARRDALRQGYFQLLNRCERLKTRFEKLGIDIEDQYGSRQRRFDALRDGLLERDGVNLAQLTDDVASYQESLPRGEMELRETAGRLLDSIGVARDLEKQLTQLRWPPPDAPDQIEADRQAMSALECLPKAIDDLCGLSTLDQAAGAWLRVNQRRVVGPWRGSLEVRLEQAREGLARRIVTANARLGKGDLTRPQYVELSSLRDKYEETRNSLLWRVSREIFDPGMVNTIVQARLPTLEEWSRRGDDQAPDYDLLKTDYARLLQGVESLAEEARSDSVDFEASREAIETLRQKTIGAVKEIDRVRVGPELRRLPKVPSLEQLSRELELEGGSRSGALRCRARIEALEKDIPKVARSVAAEQKSRIRTEDGQVLFLFSKLRERWEKLEEAIASVRSKREGAYAELLDRFNRGSRELPSLSGDVAEYLKQLPPEESDLGDKTRQLNNAIAAAALLQKEFDRLPPIWPAPGSLPRAALNELVNLLGRIAAILVPTDIPIVGDWWRARLEHMAPGWLDAAKLRLTQDQTELARRIQDTNRVIDQIVAGVSPSTEDAKRGHAVLTADCKSHDDVVKRLTNAVFASAVFARSDRSAFLPNPLLPTLRPWPEADRSPVQPAKPAKLPEDAIAAAAWPPGYEYPDQFTYHQTDGRIDYWYFKGRFVKPQGSDARQPVPMILICPRGDGKDQPGPFLIDRHEVTLGEVYRVRFPEKGDPDANPEAVTKYVSDFGETIRKQNKGRPDDSVLAFGVDRDQAAQFVNRAYPWLRLQLPTLAQWKAVQRFGPAFTPAQPTLPPLVGEIGADRSADGVLGLRSGLSEWGREIDPDPRGGTSYERADGPRWWTHGFRCVYELTPSPR